MHASFEIPMTRRNGCLVCNEVQVPGGTLMSMHGQDHEVLKVDKSRPSIRSLDCLASPPVQTGVVSWPSHGPPDRNSSE
jgi:hypothetical protein